MPVLIAMAALRVVGWVIDPEHRLWLPISLLQGRDFWFIGDAIILAPLLAAVRLFFRMIQGNEWEEVLVLGIACCCQLQLVMPWGEPGQGHVLFAFGAFVGYAWVLAQGGLRNQQWSLLAFGFVLLGIVAWAAVALHHFHLRLFGILEHVLLTALLLGFWWYDRTLVAAAIQREASLQTCRLNNFDPPYL
ncbi:MAG: hypothetical protein ACK5Q5_08245 [Planctomycetaceae bacterium]